MNRVDAHFRNELFSAELSKIQIDARKDEYRTLSIGQHLVLYLNNEQAEELFDELDKKLHKETYLQLQDRAFSLEVDLDTANDLIEQLEDNIQNLAQ